MERPDSEALPWFPLAAQAEIVRASQKDKLCLGVLETSLLEAAQSLLGPAFYIKHRGALHALACVLYYGTSTGVLIGWCIMCGAVEPMQCMAPRAQHTLQGLGSKHSERSTVTFCKFPAPR